MIEVGHLNRFGWVVDNTLIAVKRLLDGAGSKSKKLEFLPAATRLAALSRGLEHRRAAPPSEDILDLNIRSERTLEEVRRHLSQVSKNWSVISTIQPDDFEKALRTALAAD
ncbi:MAG: hypothetical protein H0V17_32260 [Deltaproteobacteria bacterium]|nr:hypothetical protein [Deltaproteobacteria bacterium]